MRRHLSAAAALLLLVPASAAARPADVRIINATPISVTVADPVTVQSTPAAPVYAAPSGEARFSVVRQGISDTGMLTNCTDLKTLPSGTLLIESIDLHAFSSAMTTFLLIPTRELTSATFGVDSRIPVPLASYPVQDAYGHTGTSVVIRDGLGNAGPGEPVRDATHPVRICVKDNTTSSATNSIWTVSGRVLR